MPIVVNHAVTPEYYNVHPGPKSDLVKALFISCEKNTEPKVVIDTPNSILSAVFKDEKPFCVHFDRGFYMYVSPMESSIGKYANFVATNMLRMNGLFHQTDVIYGHVLIFGSYNLKTFVIDNKHYSVPYDIVEESWRIYDVQKC